MREKKEGGATLESRTRLCMRRLRWMSKYAAGSKELSEERSCPEWRRPRFRLSPQTPFRLARMGAHKVETCKPALMCKQAKITDEKEMKKKRSREMQNCKDEAQDRFPTTTNITSTLNAWKMVKDQSNIQFAGYNSSSKVRNSYRHWTLTPDFIFNNYDAWEFLS